MGSEGEADSVEEVPLHRLKPFGTGLYRKKIAFVPAVSEDWREDDGGSASASEASGKEVADWYLRQSPPQGAGARGRDGAEGRRRL